MTMVDITEVLSFDRDASRAVIIGSSRFPRDPEHLRELPAVVANVIDFERCLRDPTIIGLSPHAIARLLDREDGSKVAERVEQACREAEDLLLLYYAGHGLIAGNGELLLTFQNSTAVQPDANCLRWETIKSYVLQSDAKKKLVILDCCFSGRASELMGSTEQTLRGDLETSGTIVLASSARNQPSLARDEERRTAFTEALLETIETGLDNSRPGLSIEEIFANTKQRLKSRGEPEPQRVASSDVSDVVLVLNQRSEISRELSSFNEIMAQIEARLNVFLDRRLGSETYDLPISANYPNGRRSLLKSLLIWACLTIIVIAESIGLLALSCESTGQLISVTATLLVTSVVFFSLALSALKSPEKPTTLKALMFSRQACQTTARFGILNFVLVAILAFISPSAQYYCYYYF